MAKAFAHFLNDLRDGRTHAELSEQLDRLLAAVKSTSKQGELILKIKVKPAAKGDCDKVHITDDVVLKLPVGERGADFFWLTDENELSRNHPRQGNLNLREAAQAAPSTFKEVNQ